MHAGTVFGACGLILAGAGAAHAQTGPEPSSLLSSVLGADVGTLTAMTSGVICNNRLADIHYKSPVYKSPMPHPCVNGPVHSGNSVNSGNFINHGNPNSSGNIDNTNGSTNSHNASTGNTAGSTNAVQNLLGGLVPRL
ncbi:exported protein of unknown function [Streptantibioticus cattleyicolor NRRL 8057 = DSM 46488]|nr:exported protein of unknown function [Streptantibioticus cattleyicolor NRRL 8057 = DSM 46488]